MEVYCLILLWHPASNFTNMLWEAFAPVSFRHKIAKPNFRQFHQRFTSIFHAKFWRQKVSKPKQSFAIFGAKISYEKFELNMLMKLTHENCSKQFCKKNARPKMLVKLIPIIVNFTNIFQAAFAPVSFHQNIINPNWKHIIVAHNTKQKSCSY